MSAGANSLVIVAFGTSLTARGGWQAALETAVQSCLGHEVKVISVAKPGANSDWAVDNIRSVIACEPDVVVVEFSINDASLLRGVSRDKSRANVSQIIAELRAYRGNVDVVLLATSPAWGWRGWVRPMLDRYYDQLAAIAAEKDVGFVDLRPAWQKDCKAAIPDGLHPDPVTFGAILSPAVANAICKVRTGVRASAGDLL